LIDEEYTTVKTAFHSCPWKINYFVSVCRDSFMRTQPQCSGCVRVPLQANNYLLLRYKTSTCSN